MLKTGAITVAFCVLGVAVILATEPRQTQISDLLVQPDRFENRQVTVRGRADLNAGVLGIGGYRLSDDGQSIIVLTHRKVPAYGTPVEVTGTFRRALVVGRTEAFVIVED